MVYRELNRLDINIIAYNIGCQDTALGIVDQSTRSIQNLVFCMLTTGELSQAVPILRLKHLPVIEPPQQDEHAEADQQEDEHLPCAGTPQFCAHHLLPFSDERVLHYPLIILQGS